MRYPHAHKGVKKIFASSLLEIIATVLSVVAAVLLVLPESKAEGSSLPATAAALALVAGIIVIVSFFLELIGLFQAKNDERNFGNALWIIFFAILASLVSTFISFASGTWVDVTKAILDRFGSLCGMIVTLYIVTGIANLADSLGEKGYAHRGRVIRMILVYLFLLSFVMTMLSTFIRFNDIVTKIMGYVSIAAGGVELVANIWFFFYLARAPKKLSK